MSRKKTAGDDNPPDTFGHFGTQDCMAPGCSVQIARHRAFCENHYSRLSVAQREKLAGAYRDWQTGHEGTLQRLREVQAECVRLIQQAEDGSRKP